MRAGLHLVERNDDVLEEQDVLVSQRHSKARDDRGLDVENLGRAVELMTLMHESEEALIHCFSNHLAPRYELCVQFVQNVFEVVALNGLS